MPGFGTDTPSFLYKRKRKL